MEQADLSNNNFQLSKPIFVILKLKMNLNADCQFWTNSLSVLVFVNKPRVDVKLLHLQTHGIFQVCFTILHQAFMFGVFTSVQHSPRGLVSEVLVLFMMTTWVSLL